jgi:hypothetical protein
MRHTPAGRSLLVQLCIEGAQLAFTWPKKVSKVRLNPFYYTHTVCGTVPAAGTCATFVTVPAEPGFVQPRPTSPARRSALRCTNVPRHTAFLLRVCLPQSLAAESHAGTVPGVGPRAAAAAASCVYAAAL